MSYVSDTQLIKSQKTTLICRHTCVRQCKGSKEVCFEAICTEIGMTEAGNRDDDTLSPFREVETLMKCALPPSSFEFPIETVKYQLNNLLFRYNFDMGGIPICYSKISFPRGKEYGRIIGQHPSVHVDIQTKLVVFQPKIGQKIFGKITKVNE